MSLKKIVEYFKSKNVLWYTGVALAVLGILGILYGIWICYNGVLIIGDRSDELFNLLDSLGMTARDGSRALILVGSVLIILYLFTLGLGVLGVISSGRYLTKRNLFWFAIVIAAFFSLLGLIHILGWIVAGITILLLILYALSIYVKYNKDKIELKYLKREQERKKREIYPENP